MTRRTYKLRIGFVFGMLFAIAPLTWSAHNYLKVGHFVLSYISNVNLLLYRAAGALAITEPGDFYRNLETHQQELVNRACADLERLYGQDCAAIAVPDKAAYFSRIGAAILLSRPTASARLTLRGATAMMLGLDSQVVARILHMRLRPAKLLARFYMCGVALLWLLGAASWWKQRRQMFYLFFFTSTYFILLSAGAEAYNRFRVPITPLCVMAEAAGFQVVFAFCCRFRNKWRSRLRATPDRESQPCAV